MDNKFIHGTFIDDGSPHYAAIRISRFLLSLQQTNQQQQHNRANCRHNQGAQQTGTGTDAQEAKDKAPQQRAYYTDHQIANQAKTATFDKLPCQPTGGNTNQYEPNNFHEMPLVKNKKNRHPTIARSRLADTTCHKHLLMPRP
jgi:hypothetical protein